jgi:rsbT co-antagonist protein RsbR
MSQNTDRDPAKDTNGDAVWHAHQIIDTSPTFVVAIDAAGSTEFMNMTMLQALGYSREEATGKNYLQTFVPHREHAVLLGIFQKLTAHDQVTLNENHVVTREGREILVEWHGRPIFDDQGRLQYFYGVGIDVTEQRRTQNALLNSQQRLALHFKQSPLGMIEWDREFRVVDWNPAAERIFGYSREEALGQYGQDLVVPEPVRPYVADVWNQLLESRGAVNAHNENITKDGRTIVCEWSNTTLIDASGEVVGVASLVNDVTDRKKAEEDLRERERAQAETIAQLSVPIIDIWEGILALPIVGSIDEARAMRMTEALLDAIVRTGTRFAILDLTGATAVDATIANHLGDMIRATRLVGSECFVSGLGPEIARKLVEFDIALSVRTFGSLRAALRHAIRHTRE